MPYARYFFFYLGGCPLISLVLAIQYEALEQLCNERRAREAVLAEMDAIGREAEVYRPLKR